MAKKALVTGASGLLGREIVKAFQRVGWDVVGTALTRTSPPSIVKLDLESDEEIVNVLKEVKPDVVVHAAATRHPDKVTADPASAHRVNATASATLAQETYRRSIFLLYISTDYVFSGKPDEAPYKTSATPSPTNAYGQTKLDGEIGVLQNTGGWAEDDVKVSGENGMSKSNTVLGAVLRVPLLYGRVEDNEPSKSAVHALLDAIYKAQDVTSGEGQAKIKVDDYALRYPTCTEDVARACVDICKRYTAGSKRAEEAGKTESLPRILHFSSEQKFTKYEMCEILAEILGLPTSNLERWDPTEDDARATTEGRPVTVRPYNTHLDISDLNGLGIDVSCVDFKDWWQRELRAFKH